MRYEALTAKDSAAALSEKLSDIASRGGRAISVMWKPQREDPKDFNKALRAQYVIVAEFPDAPAVPAAPRKKAATTAA